MFLRFGVVEKIPFFYVDRLFVVISACFQILSFQKKLGCVFQLVRDSDVPEPRG